MDRIVANPSVSDVLGCLDAMGEAAATSATSSVAFEAAVQIRRLLAGDFTKEEIHNFCHKIPATVSAQEFASGCMAYQMEIYGSSPVMELLRDTDRILKSWGILTDLPAPGAMLRKRIREQIL